MKKLLTESEILENNKRVITEGLDDRLIIDGNPYERLYKDVMGFGQELLEEYGGNFDEWEDDATGYQTVAEKAIEVLESPALANRAILYLEKQGFDRNSDAASVPERLWNRVVSIVIDDEMNAGQPAPRRIRPAMESFIMGENLFGRSGYGKSILREGVYEDEDYYGENDGTGFDDGEQTVESKANELSESAYLADLTIRRLERMGYDRYEPASSVPDRIWNKVLGDSIESAMDNPDATPTDDDIDDVPTMESAEFVATQQVVDKPEGMEKPEIKKQECNLVAKRNRRLRSRTRNIQLWDKKKKTFAPEYINTRFNRMSDANAAIEKITSKVNESVGEPLVIHGYSESVNWGDSGDPDDYESGTEDEGTKEFDDAEEVYRFLRNEGCGPMEGCDWWETGTIEDRDYIENGTDRHMTYHPESGFSDEVVEYINGRLAGEREEEEEFSNSFVGDDDSDI